MDNNNMSYTSRDYLSIYDDLVSTANTLSSSWTDRSETDPGIVLLKLMSMLGDVLSYNQDRAALELYPNTVTERKNAKMIFSLIGYKMEWYKSAIAYVALTNYSTERAYIPKYSTISTDDGSITYTSLEDVYIDPGDTTHNIEFVEGSPIIPGRNSDGSFKTNIAINQFDSNCCYYFPYNNIDEDHIELIDNNGEVWTQISDVELASETGRYFEFNVNSDDNPYIKLVPYYNRYDVSSFKLFYIRSSGKSGSVNSNLLTKITSTAYSISYGGSSINDSIYVRNNASTSGHDPETPSEAFISSRKYVNTFDTLVTLSDYKNAILRLNDVDNVVCTDITNDPNNGLSSYDLKFYIVRSNYDSVDDNFIEYVRSQLYSYKILPIQMSAGSPLYYSKWKPTGIVYLKKPVDTVTANEILLKIDSVLATEYSCRNVKFGEQLKYLDVINTIESAYDGIEYVEMSSPITYNVVPSSGSGLPTASAISKKIIDKSIDITMVSSEYTDAVTALLTEDQLAFRVLDNDKPKALLVADAVNNNKFLSSYHPYNIISISRYDGISNLVISPDSIRG